MVKADSQSLMALSKEIREKLDEFLLHMNNIYRLQNRLENTWDSDKFGSFMAVINAIKGCTEDVYQGCMDAQKQICDMIEIVRKYESVHF